MFPAVVGYDRISDMEQTSRLGQLCPRLSFKQPGWLAVNLSVQVVHHCLTLERKRESSKHSFFEAKCSPDRSWEELSSEVHVHADCPWKKWKTKSSDTLMIKGSIGSDVSITLFLEAVVCYDLEHLVLERKCFYESWLECLLFGGRSV